MAAIAPPGSKPWLTIGPQHVVTYAQDEAEAVLAGFAFGSEPLDWPWRFEPPKDHGLDSAPRATVRATWGYRTYDCAPCSPYAFDVADLLIVAALDAGASGDAILAMEAVLPDLNEVLANIDLGQTFWTMSPDDLGATSPQEGTPAWWLWRAWVLLRGAKGVGPTITDKVLHHKRPWLFPIFDDATRQAMGAESAWRVLHAELQDQAAQFVYLEQWFAARAAERGGVGLSRLRIHDILHWGNIARGGAERERLIHAGRSVLGRSTA
jgi:hypothetical protein